MSDIDSVSRDDVGDVGAFSRTRPLPESLRSFQYLGSARNYEEEISEIVDRIWLFEDLSRDEVRSLCAEMECFAAKRGEKILQEGDTGDFLLIVLTGEVSVVKEKDVDVRKVITTVGPGASLGEMSLIDGMPRFASCVAVGPTDFAVLTRDTLYDLLILKPALGNKVLLILLQILSKRLRETSERLLPFIAGIPV